MPPPTHQCAAATVHRQQDLRGQDGCVLPWDQGCLSLLLDCIWWLNTHNILIYDLFVQVYPDNMTNKFRVRVGNTIHDFEECDQRPGLGVLWKCEYNVFLYPGVTWLLSSLHILIICFVFVHTVAIEKQVAQHPPPKYPRFSFGEVDINSEDSGCQQQLTTNIHRKGSTFGMYMPLYAPEYQI